MRDLDQKEQGHVRAALHFLRIQMGGVKVVANALRAEYTTFTKVAGGSKPVSASIALRVARLLDVSFDDLLLGRYQPGACPKCGHKPSYVPVYRSDFKDENTIVEIESRPTTGLTLVR